MFEKLQKKFVLLTTTISVLVLVFIAVMINAINYTSIHRKSDEMIDLLIGNNMMLNESLGQPKNLPREILFTTRFFDVAFDTTGNIIHVNTKNISSVSPEKAVWYASEVYGNSSGIIDDYKYLVSENPNGKIVVFLDIQNEINGLNDYVLYSFIVVSIAILLILTLSIFLSKKAVEPYVQGYKRQKSFITNVSHEFKTPLAIIRADCDVLELENSETEWTNSIKKQISRLNTLVENLISLTKLDEKAKLLKTEFSLNDALEETINQFSSSIMGANINLHENINDNITYRGDESLIRELMSILIENAIKYSTGEIKISLKSKVLTIENSCKNIEIGRHNEWFERFYRGDSSRNSTVKGFGIGLSVAKDICNMHGAKIFAESKTKQNVIITVNF